MERLGLYARVSKDTSGRARSVEEQDADLEADAAANGWGIVARYTDKSLSASRFATHSGRAGWAALLADIDAGKLDIVAFWASSRGSRKMAEWASFLDLCRDRNVRIWIHTDEMLYNPSNARHRKMLLNDGIENEMSSENQSPAIRRALATNLANGKHHGKPPFGYRLVHKTDENGELVYTRDKQGNRNVVTEWAEHPEEARIVREVFRRAIAREPLRALSRELGLSRRALNHMLGNRTYLAERKGGVPGKWPALITREEFRAAAALLNEPGRKVTRGNQPKYLLSHIAKCPCGEYLGVLHRNLTREWAGTSHMWSEPAIPAATRVAHYACPTGKSGHSGRVPVMWADLMAALEIGAFFSAQRQWDFLSAPDESEAARLDAEITAARGELAAMEADAIKSGSAAMARIVIAQEARVKALEAERAALVRPGLPEALLSAGNGLDGRKARIAAVMKAWYGLGLAVQRSSLRASAAPVLRPASESLADPRRWEWNWGIAA